MADMPKQFMRDVFSHLSQDPHAAARVVRGFAEAGDMESIRYILDECLLPLKNSGSLANAVTTLIQGEHGGTEDRRSLALEWLARCGGYSGGERCMSEERLRALEWSAGGMGSVTVQAVLDRLLYHCVDDPNVTDYQGIMVLGANPAAPVGPGGQTALGKAVEERSEGRAVAMIQNCMRHGRMPLCNASKTVFDIYASPKTNPVHLPYMRNVLRPGALAGAPQEWSINIGKAVNRTLENRRSLSLVRPKGIDETEDAQRYVALLANVSGLSNGRFSLVFDYLNEGGRFTSFVKGTEEQRLPIANALWDRMVEHGLGINSPIARLLDGTPCPMLHAEVERCQVGNVESLLARGADPTINARPVDLFGDVIEDRPGYEGGGKDALAIAETTGDKEIISLLRAWVAKNTMSKYMRACRVSPASPG